MTHIVSIIGTHQARLRCLLSGFGMDNVQRFQNGSIIKIMITSTTIDISLLYGGEVNEKKEGRKYYVMSHYVKKETDVFEPIEFPKVNIPNNMFNNLGDNIYDFYLIRHGQGTHNVIKGIKKKIGAVFGTKDTELTPEGIAQANRAGTFLGDTSMPHIPGDSSQVEFIFVSDLKRTKQTVSALLQSAKIKAEKSRWIRDLDIHVYNSGPNNTYVLPCSHELNYSKDGQCDGSYGQAMNANENKTSCDDISKCNTDNINWDYYSNFYDGTRSKPGSAKHQCRNTSIISEAIKIIQEVKNNHNTIGGKRKTKKRKTKKTKRKTKRKTNKRKYKKRKTKK